MDLDFGDNFTTFQRVVCVVIKTEEVILILNDNIVIQIQFIVIEKVLMQLKNLLLGYKISTF